MGRSFFANGGVRSEVTNYPWNEAVSLLSPISAVYNERTFLRIGFHTTT